MKLLRPVTIVDATLVSSTVSEPSGSDPSAWSSGTNYAIAATAYVGGTTHRIYQAVLASGPANGGAVDPTTDADASHWAEVSGTNKWAMFDTGVSSATEGTSPLTVVFKPGFVDSLALIGCVGDTVTVTIRDGLAGAIVYGPTAYTLTATVSDWYAYFVSPTRYIPMVLLSDLPIYLDAHFTVTVAGSGTVSCAMCVPGQSFILGYTQYGVGIGIRDYSRKVTNETTGVVTLEQRKFAKTMTAQVRLDSAQYAEVQETLEGLRATPCVWIGDKTGDISPLTVYGFYKDFRLVVDYPTGGVYSLEIEGMV